MAGADFRIDLAAAEAVEARLKLLADRLGDLTPLMDIIGTTVESDVHDNFQGEHGPDGTPWKPSQRVLRSAVGKSGPQRTTGKTLQDSRRLALSITHRAGRDFAEVGTNVIYASRHQQGFKGTERVGAHKRRMASVFGVKLREPIEVTVGAFSRTGNTPARPFLGVSAGAWEDIAGEVADYVGADA